MIRMREQAIRFGAEIQTVRASRVDLIRPFGVWVGDPGAAEPTHRARTVIISTGAQSLMLGIEREIELVGHGVSTCATCDGFFFQEHDIAVVGGGDSALEEALFSQVRPVGDPGPSSRPCRRRRSCSSRLLPMTRSGSSGTAEWSSCTATASSRGRPRGHAHGERSRLDVTGLS